MKGVDCPICGERLVALSMWPEEQLRRLSPWYYVLLHAGGGHS